MALDGSTLTLVYPDTSLYDGRCEVYKPTTVLTDGAPDSRDWDLVHTDWPFHWKRAKGLDQTWGAMLGRMDQDLVFTTEILYMPVDTDVDQGYWVRDVTVRPDGTHTRNYGRWFVCRGNPSWNEAPESPEYSWLTINCSVEATAPAWITAVIPA